MRMYVCMYLAQSLMQRHHNSAAASLQPIQVVGNRLQHTRAPGEQIEWREVFSPAARAAGSRRECWPRRCDVAP